MEKRYKTILIDPPWPIKFIERKVRPNQKLAYDTMSIEEIAGLKINDYADNDCNLFCWTTQTYLPKTFEIIKGWGFKYHITLTWEKGDGLVMFGFHRRTEFCVFAYKGKIQIEKNGKAIPTNISPIPDMFDSKNKYHSKKPDLFYRYIEANTPEPRLEIFARNKREGWDVFGNEVESDVQLIGEKVL